MPAPILPIRTIAVPELAAPPFPKGQGAAGVAGEFRNVLEGAIGNLEHARTEAGQAVQKFLSGEGEELHSTVMATQRAELMFELALQVRNKVVNAYQEIMRMQM